MIIKSPVRRVITMAIVAGCLAGADIVHADTMVTDRLSAQFTLCGERRRVNCIVDGDTFWFQRQKIRIADIDAPELSPSRCTYEREKGEVAKQRLLDLLNAGPFSLSTGDRDRDRHGRKLRVVMRGGRSIGERLIEEDLARPWDGARRPWCTDQR